MIVVCTSMGSLQTGSTNGKFGMLLMAPICQNVNKYRRTNWGSSCTSCFIPGSNPNICFVTFECGSNKDPQCNTHHYMCRGAFNQAVQEQPSGSTEDAVKDPGIRNLLLLLLVHESFHKQLQDRNSIIIKVYLPTLRSI